MSNRRCLHPDVGVLLLPPGLISKWVGEAAAQFSNAPIQAFVPILVERIVRGRVYNTRADRDARGMH